MVALRYVSGLAIDRSRVQFPACLPSHNIGQLSLASLQGSPNRVPASAGGKGRIHTSVGW